MPSAPDPVLPNLPRTAISIPSIDLAAVYDRRYARDEIQYGNLTTLADLMGLTPVPHRHDGFLQIHLIEYGAFQLRLDADLFDAEGPAIFTTPPGVPHAFSFAPNVRGHVLTVRESFVKALLEKDPGLPVWDRISAACTEFRGIEANRQFAEIALSFRMLFREMSRREPGSDTVCGGLAAVIISQTLRAPKVAPSQGEETWRDLKQYRRFLQLVERHFADHWAVSRYASELGMTAWKLNEVCRTCGASTPKSVIHERLLVEAKRQLTFSEASVKAIAAALGFIDTAYFCRFFKRMTNESAQMFRHRIHRRNQP